nr:TrmB family transcriptional regulator [Aequitasia blattaphilus]
MQFGLTRQESLVYQCLITEGTISGYEVAKQLGISRSNAYNSLASLAEKGGAYTVEEGSTKKYVPVELREFTRNHIREIEDARMWLISHMPEQKEVSEGYITIEGENNILNKLKNLLKSTKEHAYLSCTRSYLLYFVRELRELSEQGKKVVILTDQAVSVEDFKVYFSEDRGTSIGLIIDSQYAITGEYGEGSQNTCLYSGQKVFVELFKNALGNEIKLLSLNEESY